MPLALRRSTNIEDDTNEYRRFLMILTLYLSLLVAHLHSSLGYIHNRLMTPTPTSICNTRTRTLYLLLFADRAIEKLPACFVGAQRLSWLSFHVPRTVACRTPGNAQSCC